jgi:hypothetical protein
MITKLRRRVGRGGVAMVAALALMLPAAGAATATAATAVPASTSAAATQSAWSMQTVNTCLSSNRIRHKPIKVRAGGRTIGWVNVVRGGGKIKCAQVVHAGPSWGKPRYTEIEVWNSRYGSAGTGSTASYWSSGIQSTGIRCINVRGSIDWKGRTRAVTIRDVCTS